MTIQISPHATIGNATLYLGKSEIVLVGFPSNSIGACICDPPYHLGDTRPQQRGYPQRGEDGAWAEEGRRKAESAGGFMGMKWDGGGIAFSVELWREVYRVLKPGAYLAAFSGSRTYHRMACAIEDAGFTIKDMIQWDYGTGFPKSHNISKAIDKKAGAKRGKKRVEAANPKATGRGKDGKIGATRPVIERALAGDGMTETDDDTPITELAAQWDGYGTALKPGHEPIVLAQKPLEGTYAANVEKWGVGALNIDKCRIATEDSTIRHGSGGFGANFSDDGWVPPETSTNGGHTAGRYPPNILLTHSLFCIPNHCDPSCPVGQLDKQGGGVKRGDSATRNPRVKTATTVFGFGDGKPEGVQTGGHADNGGVSRFFPILDWSEDDYWWFKYIPKPTKREKDAGLDGFELVTVELWQEGTPQWEKADLRVRLRVDTEPSPPRVIGGYDIPEQDASSWNTFMFGSASMGLSRAVRKSTTKILTSSTMRSETLRLLLASHISASTQDANSEKASGGNRAASAESSSRSLDFTSGETASVPSVGSVASGARWRISASDPDARHVTVKPLAVMGWLIDLCVPKGETLIDPFAGSGTTLCAARQRKIASIGIDMEPDHLAIQIARLGANTIKGWE